MLYIGKVGTSPKVCSTLFLLGALNQSELKYVTQHHVTLISLLCWVLPKFLFSVEYWSMTIISMQYVLNGVLNHLFRCNESYIFVNAFKKMKHSVCPLFSVNSSSSSGAFHLVRTQSYMLSGPTHPLFACNTQWKCIGDLTPPTSLGAYVLNGRPPGEKLCKFMPGRCK